MVAPAILRRPDVERLTQLSKASIYRLMAAGRFPAAIRLGERAVAWRATEIEAWIASRPRSHGDGIDPAAGKRGGAS